MHIFSLDRRMQTLWWLEDLFTLLDLWLLFIAEFMSSKTYSTGFFIMKRRHQWWSLETWSQSRDASRDPFFEVSVSKVSGLVSVSKDFGLGLELFVSRFCIGYFFWSFARKSSFKKRFWKTIVQNFAVQGGQWLSYPCCYVVYEMEKKSALYPFKICTEFNKKCARTKETVARNLCIERLGVLC